LNNSINFKNSPFRLQQKLEEWAENKQVESESKTGIRFVQRLALLNSFGTGGSCASMVIEDYDKLIEKRKEENTKYNIIKKEVNAKVGIAEDKEIINIELSNEGFYEDLLKRFKQKTISREEF
jgi:hypothetical protein